MLRKLVAFLLSLLAVSTVLSAQDDKKTMSQEEYAREWRRAYDTLVSGKWDEGIALYKQLIGVNPRDAVAHYNIACGYSLKKEIDTAFGWLTKAVELGFGNTDTNIEQLETKDTDLANLRGDARWAPLVARMKAIKKEIDDYVAQPGIHVPAAIQDLPEKPLLVVLHDYGATKEQVLAGPWKAVADELGLALLAPSGKFPTQGKPSDGMTWIDSPDGYLANNWTYEKPVDIALKVFKEGHKYDKARVWIAGEGIGGTLALTLATSYPGLYKGVLALDAQPFDRLVAPKVQAAAKMGLAVKILLAAGSIDGPDGKPVDMAAVAMALDKKLKDWKLAGSAETYAPLTEHPEKKKDLLLAGLKAIMAAPQTVEAGSGK